MYQRQHPGANSHVVCTLCIDDMFGESRVLVLGVGKLFKLKEKVRNIKYMVDIENYEIDSK